jgi:hypothetical protein
VGDAAAVRIFLLCVQRHQRASDDRATRTAAASLPYTLTPAHTIPALPSKLYKRIMHHFPRTASLVCAYTFQPASPQNHLLRCSRCKDVWYSSIDSQRNHWKLHKKTCTPLSPELAVDISRYTLETVVGLLMTQLWFKPTGRGSDNSAGAGTGGDRAGAAGAAVGTTTPCVTGIQCNHTTAPLIRRFRVLCDDPLVSARGGGGHHGFCHARISPIEWWWRCTSFDGYIHSRMLLGFTVHLSVQKFLWVEFNLSIRARHVRSNSMPLRRPLSYGSHDGYRQSTEGRSNHSEHICHWVPCT